MVATVLIAGPITFVLVRAIDALSGGWVVEAATEIGGLDAFAHGERAFDFSSELGSAATVSEPIRATSPPLRPSSRCTRGSRGAPALGSASSAATQRPRVPSTSI